MNGKRVVFSTATVLTIAALALAGCQTKPAVAMAAPIAAPEAPAPPAPTAAPITAAAPITDTPPAPIPQVAPAQAAPPAAQARTPLAAGESIIQTEALGFSPTAADGRTSIDFALLLSNADAVKSWRVAIVGPAGALKVFAGSGPQAPSTLTWDGTADSGKMAADGRYTAALSVDYGNAFKPTTTTSRPFLVDSAAPKGSIAVSPPLFSPSNPGNRVTIAIAADASAAKVDSWSLDIYDPGGNLFKTFDGKGSDGKVVWDGKGIKGDLVVSAEDYPVMVRIRDEFGNVGTVKSTIPIDIIVIKQADGYRIPNSRVYFRDFTADYRTIAPELAAQNSTRLDDLAAMLKKFPGYKIKILGHAVMIHWDDPVLGKIEEDSVLVPLSKARAEAIKQAMADRGLELSMMEAVGVGAADPLVPDSDYADRWQNRRTAIFLMK